MSRGRVVGVRDRPGQVALAIPGAFHEAGCELASEWDVLTIDRDSLIVVHNRGVHRVKPRRGVVQGDHQDAADDGGQQDDAKDRQPCDGPAGASSFDRNSHACSSAEAGTGV